VKFTFIAIGGLLPTFADINNLLACFVMGFLLRQILLTIFKIKSDITKSVIESCIKIKLYIIKSIIDNYNSEE
jgi:hypothetical protein